MKLTAMKMLGGHNVLHMVKILERSKIGICRIGGVKGIHWRYEGQSVSNMPEILMRSNTE